MTAQVAADLRAAAEVLKRDGWKQQTYGSPAGCKCLYGAIHFVVSDGEAVSDIELTDKQSRRADPVEDAIKRYLDASSWVGIIDFNDAPGRTADEVIAALEAAADAAEADQ